ncbi:MAG: monofunctional biosynthetic peptidoglycan transglycosylase [Spirochaetaceae bacterium]|jgi:monofunctional biosynthetic peptidoglycan transglycosylase|nr:monofunctional biosynthetic peptidoglycan transglycosylase [Spirochaetaceae bacterium]
MLFSSNLTFKQITDLIVKIILSLIVASFIYVIILRWFPVYYTPLYTMRKVQAFKQEKTIPFLKSWVPIDEISPHLIRGVLAAEDDQFLKHYGFSIENIKMAMSQNKKAGKIVRGGSTISQQTAKNVFLLPTKSYFRKILEAYFTILIELFWGKKRIMEVYLNVIEMGNGIYGAQAAAIHFYGCNASELSKHQAAMIAISLPNPRRFRVDSPSEYMVERQKKIMGYMSSTDASYFTEEKNN